MTDTAKPIVCDLEYEDIAYRVRQVSGVDVTAHVLGVLGEDEAEAVAILLDERRFAERLRESLRADPTLVDGQGVQRPWNIRDRDPIAVISQSIGAGEEGALQPTETWRRWNAATLASGAVVARRARVLGALEDSVRDSLRVYGRDFETDALVRLASIVLGHDGGPDAFRAALEAYAGDDAVGALRAAAAAKAAGIV